MINISRISFGVWYEGIHIPLAFRLLGMQCLTIWMLGNVNISMFGLTRNLRESEILTFGLFLGILKEIFIFPIQPLNL